MSAPSATAAQDPEDTSNKCLSSSSAKTQGPEIPTWQLANIAKNIIFKEDQAEMIRRELIVYVLWPSAVISMHD